jgi:5'-nucleotidase
VGAPGVTDGRRASVDRPTILLSNDDGVNAPGLEALRREMATLGRAIVVAPDREMSAASHSLTVHVPLRANRVADDIVKVEGTPTDCVLLAVQHLLPEPPDLVVSGVNRGPNLGNDVTYSGTVAAAIEGTLLGIPSIAVSLDRSEGGEYDYSFAAAIAREVALLVLERGLPDGTLLNVNVPNRPRNQIKGIATARLGKQIYEESIVKKTDPRGKRYYWIGGQLSTWKVESDTDLAIVADGWVSVTPIQLDLTDYRGLEALKTWPLDGVAEALAIGGGPEASETEEET